MRPIEDEGNETMNERIDARSVLRTTGMRCTDVIGDEDQIESMELHWIEQAETVGTCALCGCCVDESGGCLRCQIVRLPVNEGSEAVVEAAVEAVVEGAVKVVAEDRHDFTEMSEDGPERVAWEKRRFKWVMALMED